MTTIQHLYKKDINRPLNPAVSADDFSAATIQTEIDEYVFTDEIINGLYQVLYAIWTQNVSHNGIWINGFFGSGKSHFLKYLGYCINPQHREAALQRLKQAVSERDPLLVPDSKSQVTIDDLKQLAAWIQKATIDVVLFNIGTVHNTNSDEKEVFTQVFWNQFNRFRGYNAFNLALAQNLEKVLDRAGVFATFKERLDAEGFNWNEQAAMLATVYLDHVLEVAKELLPALTVDSVRKAIMDNKENVSPEAFCAELKEFIDRKNDKNYRLLFLVDEVSQFISNREYLLLQLQEVVTGLHKYGNDKAWVACTAQQDLSQLMSNMQIVSTSEDYGKIMGRFEVRVSLKGTQTEYITQKRLLDKNETGREVLDKVWENNHLAIENQFTLPSSFHTYKDEEDFINYYPFVPYQFRLIMKVLDSFGHLRYIDSQSRGNERSIIKITHNTADKHKDDEVGQLISFDKFYNAMFEGSLMASGQRAIGNALGMIQEYDDRNFAQRVVNTLFMICNLSAPDKLLFPATQEHIVTLLMDKVDCDKAALIARTEKALAFLDHKHIIRIERFTDGRADVYCFQSEDEIDAAREIESMQIDQATMAKYFADIFSKHFKCTASSNKEVYGSRSFSIGWAIYGRNFYANNADINIEFLLGKQPSDVKFFGNEPHKLTYNIEEELAKDKLLTNDFFWYCQVQKFAAEKINSETRRKTIESFAQRANEVYEKRIVPKMCHILNKCEIWSGNSVIQVAGEGAQRYKNALNQHFANVYTHANMVVGASVPTTADSLRNSITRPIEPNEYSALNPMTTAEQELEQYIRGQFGTVFVSEIVRTFSARPYGWSDFATLYFLNELRRRGRWTLKYNNDANIDSQIIAQHIVKEQNKFTVVQATAISQELINEFVEAWKYALNTPTAPASYDSGELFRLCKHTAPGEKQVSLHSIQQSYGQIRKEIAVYPFVTVIDNALELLERWDTERDHEKFFKRVIAEREQAKEIFDRCKTLLAFVKDHLPAYLQIRNFTLQHKDNFAFLTQQDKVAELQAILTDAWPMPHMKQYNLLYRELGKALEQVKLEKQQEIEHRYQQVFTDLRQIAAEANVAYQIDEDEVVRQMTDSENLYVLDNNLNTTDYRTEQVQEIMNRKHSQEGNGDGTEQPKRRTRMVSLHTGSTQPINTEADVDNYLAKLKVELMKYVNAREENDDIMVK